MKAASKRPIWLPALLALLLLAGTADAQGPQGQPFGLGLTLGEPAGVSAKLWFDSKSALDMAVGYGFFPHSGPAFFVDYVYHVLTLVRPLRVPFFLKLYMGVGAKAGVWYYHRDAADHHGFSMGVRFPFGLTMVFTTAPFDVFFEIVPAMAFVTPDPIYFDFDAAIGGRFYF